MCWLIGRVYQICAVKCLRKERRDLKFSPTAEMSSRDCVCQLYYYNYSNSGITVHAGLIALSGAIMMWFRISMNEGADPIFKPEEMRAAFHPNRLVRFA